MRSLNKRLDSSPSTNYRRRRKAVSNLKIIKAKFLNLKELFKKASNKKQE